MESSSPASKRASADPLGSSAADRCGDAADAAATCARACLAHPKVYDLEECIEWCLLASNVLGACAHVLTRQLGEGRSPVVAAIAEAGLKAALECAEALGSETAMDECDAAARCVAAAESLREFLAAVPVDGSQQVGATTA